MNNKETNNYLGEKLLYGSKLAFKRMMEKARQNNEEVVFGQNGKLVVVKARNVK